MEVGANVIDRKVGLGVVIDAQVVKRAITPIGYLFNHEIVVGKLLKIVIIVLCVPWTFILDSRCWVPHVMVV